MLQGAMKKRESGKYFGSFDEVMCACMIGLYGLIMQAFGYI